MEYDDDDDDDDDDATTVRWTNIVGLRREWSDCSTDNRRWDADADDDADCICQASPCQVNCTRSKRMAVDHQPCVAILFYYAYSSKRVRTTVCLNRANTTSSSKEIKSISLISVSQCQNPTHHHTYIAADDAIIALLRITLRGDIRTDSTNLEKTRTRVCCERTYITR